eukprot:CAMPEP_0181211728 /NCGR_PEP_ID=MMETSP1096-20121128/23957_1 /TAXON_ID=156174 ORGANISM="Chrysochromulina ericina, Strain CCMP281" /NCGR_SAMPLE_ID=MMETSP1096 /ASSEMBLY_ACC=CAM_ASM_000453 /LENGTH=45 /DNA_ID= /DNA_START= /DNA_END= /DNA_ORIENTATION=
MMSGRILWLAINGWNLIDARKGLPISIDCNTTHNSCHLVDAASNI